MWNAALQERIESYQKTGNGVAHYDQLKSLTEIRRDVDGFNAFSVTAQRTVLRRLDKAFKNFFQRVKAGDKPGFPRFKGRNRPIKSLETGRFSIHQKGAWQSVTIKGIGRFRFKGELDGKAKLVRIVQTPLRVNVQVVVEQVLDIPEDTRPALGADVGINSRITLSNGHQEDKRVVDLAARKRKQRIPSRATRGSNSRQKKKALLAKECYRIAERERNRLYEQAATIIRDHGSKLFVEDLQIKNMTKNPKLSRSILEQQWGTFVQILTYKAENAGGWVVKVPARNTSQWCNACGALPTVKLTLADRQYHCEHCGHREDRDVNAAKNILKVGLSRQPGGETPAHREGEDYGQVVPATGRGWSDGAEQYSWASSI